MLHEKTGKMASSIKVLALLTGKVQPLSSTSEPSAIHKQALSGRGQITETGLLGDEQGDRKFHGGPEKALHHYARDHYVFWREELTPAPSVLDAPGAFGENISTLGMTEADVCIGDIYTLGSALIQVSQARQPCYKLNVRFGRREMARTVQRTGRTGWYYRVLRMGIAEAGDELVLEQRPHPDWSLARLLYVFYIDTLNIDALREIAALEALAPNWRKLARRRLENGSVESWALRLGEASRVP
jgi:MOSC domain-containing protein YiiM